MEDSRPKMSFMVPDDAPRPRLCHVKKWADFQGYGFNLHAEKGKVSSLIGLEVKKVLLHMAATVDYCVETFSISFCHYFHYATFVGCLTTSQLKYRWIVNET